MDPWTYIYIYIYIYSCAQELNIFFYSIISNLFPQTQLGCDHSTRLSRGQRAYPCHSDGLLLTLVAVLVAPDADVADVVAYPEVAVLVEVV